ncbi:hypothetical protein A6R68_17087 [Neotoma lepida]|uniref:Homeobox domain-containing protein n=1 Tax=Neotoma lepida TaxID=56216 RepID=A0A1A6HD30_NEOLE|nr:hypothetical protein A6R68_17087 [Neotoma lepida]
MRCRPPRSSRLTSTHSSLEGSTMAFQSQHVDPNFYKLGEIEIEVNLDSEQEATAAAENGIFGEGSLNDADKIKNQGIPDPKDDVIHYIGDDIKDKSHGSHQGSGHPQLKEHKNLAVASVPQFRRTRPRIQFGLTPRQLSELEEVFEKTKYPDEIIRHTQQLLLPVPDAHAQGLLILLTSPSPKTLFTDTMWRIREKERDVLASVGVKVLVTPDEPIPYLLLENDDILGLHQSLHDEVILGKHWQSSFMWMNAR